MHSQAPRTGLSWEVVIFNTACGFSLNGTNTICLNTKIFDEFTFYDSSMFVQLSCYN